MNPLYDVIVVGGGHAGCEAALAASRLGAKTVLLSIRRKFIGRMSCNPSVGGIAKSHITRELDALGGEQARNADFTGIQFRTINTRKGPAVQAFRAQCDKPSYPARLQAVLSQQENLTVCEALVTAIWVENGTLRGVEVSSGEKISGKTVVITSGTFLRGRIMIGHKVIHAGRWGEPAANDLSVSLEKLGFEISRLKTGTPPRLHRDTINYSKMDIQPGDDPPPFFSRKANKIYENRLSGCLVLRGTADRKSKAQDNMVISNEICSPWNVADFERFSVSSGYFEQIPCWLTHTNEKTHQIIEDNLKKSSLYGGLVEGTGVRYCPSIEDKIVKFKSRASHHVFIEPEGRDNVRVYPNGTSNSLPEDIQLIMIRSISGLENAEFIRPGYAIEYDFIQPTQLFHSLETKRIESLFFAGQINGTTGYEEAAGQGFIAGVNAARKSIGIRPFVLDRSEAYIGVLIDDLVTKGTDEPYRMFTSRAEYRLLLRQDNAYFRLHSRTKELGIVAEEDVAEIAAMRQQIARETDRLKKIFYEGASLAQILCRPGNNYRSLTGADRDLPAEVIEQVEINLKYEGYIERELRRVRSFQELENQRIPGDLNYDSIAALRFESREKLKKIRPETLGQASRISGVNPADISILSVWLKKSKPSV